MVRIGAFLPLAGIGVLERERFHSPRQFLVPLDEERHLFVKRIHQKPTPTPADSSVCHRAPELLNSPKLGFGVTYSRASNRTPQIPFT